MNEKTQTNIEGKVRKETFKQNQNWGKGLGGWNCWTGKENTWKEGMLRGKQEKTEERGKEEWKKRKKGGKKNKDLLVSSRWRRAAECPPGSQAPGLPWQTLWEREKDKESREFAMEWEIGRRMTARTRGGQGEVQWGLGRWIGVGLWWFCGCWWGVSAGWFGAAPATESCLWVCHWLCVIPKKPSS